MGMVVRSNIMAMNANRSLGMNNTQVTKNLEKLSSGFKINRAGDDASGLAISEKMKAQIKGLETASANSQDGISLVQTAEGALTEVHSMLNRMVELATKSANGTIQDKVDRDAIQNEVDALLAEVDRIGDSTNFNGINLLDGSLSSFAASTKSVGTPAQSAQAATKATVEFTLAKMDTAGDKLKVGDFTYTQGSAGDAGGDGTLADLKADLEKATITIDGKTYGAAMDATSGKVTLTAKTDGATALDKTKLDAAISMTGKSSALAGVSAAAGTTGKAAVAAKYTIALTGGTTGELNTKTIDGQAITWDTDLATTMGNFVTAYNGAGKEYTAAYTGGTLTLTAKAGGAVATTPTTDIAAVGGGAAPTVTEATKGAAAVAGSFTIDTTSLALPTGESLMIGAKSFASFDAMNGQEVTIGTQTYTAAMAGKTLTLTNKTAGVDATATADIQSAFKTGKAPAAITATSTNGKDLVAEKPATNGTQTLTFGDKNITKGYQMKFGSGNTAVTFEFVEQGGTAAAGNKAVTIGGDINATLTALNAAFGAAATDLATAGVTIAQDGTNPSKFVVTGNTNEAPSVNQIGAGLTLQVGDTGKDFNMVTVSVDDMRSGGLGIGGLKVNTADSARSSLQTIKDAINKVSTNRGNLGALQNRLEYTINNLDVSAENMTAANSRVRDTDMAKQMMEYTKTNVLTQAAQAMLAQANQQPQSILQLLQ